MQDVFALLDLDRPGLEEVRAKKTEQIPSQNIFVSGLAKQKY